MAGLQQQFAARSKACAVWVGEQVRLAGDCVRLACMLPLALELTSGPWRPPTPAPRTCARPRWAGSMRWQAPHGCPAPARGWPPATPLPLPLLPALLQEARTRLRRERPKRVGWASSLPHVQQPWRCYACGARLRAAQSGASPRPGSHGQALMARGAASCCMLGRLEGRRA